MEIPLIKEDFDFLTSNLFGQDPIHDFKFDKRIYGNFENMRKIYAIQHMIQQIYGQQLGGKYSEKTLQTLVDSEYSVKPKIKPETKIISTSRIDLDNKIKENSLFILYLVGFLDGDDLSELKIDKKDLTDIQYIKDQLLIKAISKINLLNYQEKGAKKTKKRRKPKKNKNSTKKKRKKKTTRKKYRGGMMASETSVDIYKEYIDKYKIYKNKILEESSSESDIEKAKNEFDESKKKKK